MSSRPTGACTYTEYEDGQAPEGYPRTGEDATGTEAEIWAALREVEDPEMPVSIVDLGLIYDVSVDEGDGARGDGTSEDGGHEATVEMTLTYTGCPAKDMLTNDVRCAAMTAAGVHDATVNVRYSPPWSVDMVTESGKEQLREFGLSV